MRVFLFVSAFLLFMLIFCISYTFGCQRDPRKWVDVLLGAVLALGAAGFVAMLAPSLYVNKIALRGDYYLPCEIVAKNEGCTFFATVDSDSQEVFAAYTGDHEWPDDVPYLLHMDGKGTKDTCDDEILVVWRAD